LTDETTWKELRSVLDEELARLPDRLRAPLVLCYLEGRTQDEAAVQLGQSKATCRRNLERGREVLGARLARRGITLSAALFALLLADGRASAALPSGLVSSAVQAAAHVAAGQAATRAVPAKVAALTEGVMKAMLLTKARASQRFCWPSSPWVACSLSAPTRSWHKIEARRRPTRRPKNLPQTRRLRGRRRRRPTPA
jgi:hypothetical protein